MTDPLHLRPSSRGRLFRSARWLVASFVLGAVAIGARPSPAGRSVAGEDERYAGAGWMFEVICCRVAMNVIIYPCDRCLLAMGEARYPFYRSVARFAWVIVAVPLGYAYAGIEGVVGAAALAEIPVFFVLWPAFHRRGMLRLSRELLAFAFFAAGAGVASLLEPLLRAWVPS